MSRGGAQGSLEYIIIIGGVIIMAIATYFLLRGFAQTTGEGTTEAMGVAGDKLRLELENLGRSETRFFIKKWGSHPMLSMITLSNTGPATTSGITLFNLSDYGLNLSEIEFAYNDSGAIKTLEYTIEQPGNPDSPVTFTSPTLPAGTPAVPSSTEILLFHNDSSALELDNLNYTSSDPEVNVTEDGGTSPVQSPDVTPPAIVISSTAFGSAGSVKDADIGVTVTDADSKIAEVKYSFANSPYLKADNLYYGFQDIVLEGHPEDYSYNSNSETIHIIATVPSEDNYTVRVRAVDEYSNERVEEQDVSIVIGVPTDATPPIILGTQPINNSETYDSPITINITTNEIAHCRFSNESGTPYSSMTDFNNTDSTDHNITDISLEDGVNYKYYFMCNDTNGNLNEDDYELNFTKYFLDLAPPVILSTLPANNTLLNVSLLTINVTTDEIAHCRYDNVSGTDYSLMDDFDNTDSTSHNITSIALEDGVNYKYYFRCNDSNGNVNAGDYLLNFSKSVELVSLMVGWSGSLFFNYSYDGGDTWPDTEFIVVTDMYDPSLMVDNNGLYWLSYHNTTHMFVRNSTDGKNWNDPVLVFVRDDEMLDVRGDMLQAQDGTYWLTSRNETQGTFQGTVGFYRSTDGSSWQNVGSFDWSPSMDAYNGFIQDSSGTFWYLGGFEGYVVLYNSSDGITWNYVEEPWYWDSGSITYVDMIQDAEGMYWVFVLDEFYGSLVCMNDSDGQNWEDEANWNSVDSNAINSLSINQDDEGIYWVVTEHTDGVYILNSTDGINWNTPVKISDGHQPTIIEG